MGQLDGDVVSVDDAMSVGVSTVSPQTTVSAAYGMVKSEGHRHLIVAASDDLVGVLCTCDIENAPMSHAISSFMTSNVHTVQSGTSLDDATERMKHEGIGCLPVMSEAGLVGVLTRGDVRRVVGSDPFSRVCAACGEVHHVRQKPDGILFCTECTDQVEPENPMRDTGVGD